MSARPASIHIPSRRSSLRIRADRRTSSVAYSTRYSDIDPAPTTPKTWLVDHPAALPMSAARRASIQSRPSKARGRKQPQSLDFTPAASTSPLRSYDRNQEPEKMKLRQSSILSAASLSSNPPQMVKRWDGSGRRSVQWDGLRRDSELWFADGDCFVHLYERGYSRRGPSFCVPMEALKHAACGNLFTLCFAHTVSRSQVPASQLSALRDAPAQMYELYIPAPEGFMREEAFQWHQTTRNFFAFLFRKPLVGTHLGGAFVDLQERLHLFRSAQPKENQAAFMEYAEEVGYLNFTHRPDNALAMLYYSEHYETKDLWIDAYAHCVGMNETLFLSSEHEPIPKVTKALITRAYLEMDLHLTRVSKAVSTFLEAELSPSNLGLPPGPRAHLERFRSFLNSFYADKFGYWPPPKGAGFSRDLCRSMYYDFKALYDYLVDIDSSESIQAQKPADGGICVLQNVQAFDKRHKYTPLPHPLPLLPTTPKPHGRVLSQRSLVSLTLGNKQSKTDKQLMQLAALSNATNSRKTTIANAPLVRVYKIFERDSLDKQKEKVSISDARKVRWILIYATLQMLVSVTRAPREVRDTEGAHYPLCCLTAGTPPWKNKRPEESVSASDSGYASAETDAGTQGAATSLPATSANDLSYSIRPDCEGSDYITHTNFQESPKLCRRSSVSQGGDMPAPLRISSISSPVRSCSRRHSVSVPPLSRTTSWRSSIGRSLSPFASRRNSIRIQPQPWCEIQVPGYGNGLNETILDEPSHTDATASPTNTVPSKSNSLRRTSLPTKLTVKTSFASPLGAFSPVTEPIVEDDERRTPIESADNSFDFSDGGAPLPAASPKGPSSVSAFSETHDGVSSKRNSYFHARHSSAASASTAGSSQLMRRSASSGSAQSSGPNSVAWSPAESSSTATSVTSRPSSPSPCNEDIATDDALSRTEQLMAELDIEATREHILRRQESIIRRSSTSRYTEMPPVRRSSSVYSSSIYSSYAADIVNSSRPGTASSDYSKARRVMGLPESVNLGDGGRMSEQDVANMYQQLAGDLWAA
ncbi:uncharacterized protein BKCO1_170001 [Diplodia corticola]|uniref:DUF8004 domain-containing protein n=1 Tax=Diplodia corticola TaxID=236234 RepID=A0A1J9S733_9PEZI|nr:uncharacterized protein BKCO1_170001 [Diplodia corticola]OJD35413.1 hypothetical protein BKCO1_170001 [Diplodia corticola]